MKKNTTKIFIAAIFLTISGTAYAGGQSWD
jgi:hypothetical protein